jgi:DnaJ-class molecular chaperone
MSKVSKDEYIKILKLESNYSTEDIKKSYKKLAFQYHPDKNPKGEEQFKLINEAYSFLINEPKEKSINHINFSLNVHTIIKITLREALEGTKIQLTYNYIRKKDLNSPNEKIKSTIVFNIPKETKLNEPVKVEKMGNVYKHIRGDLFVMCSFHPYQDGITLKGKNIYTSCKINKPEKRKKFKFKIFNYKEIEFNINPKKLNGHEYKIKKQGLKNEGHVFIKVFYNY